MTLPKDETKQKEYKERLAEVARNRVFTDDRKEKMSRSMKGKKFTEEHKQKLAEANRKRAAQTPSKKVKMICEYCGKRFESYPSELRKGRKYCSYECSVNVRNGKKIKYKSGDCHPNKGIPRTQEVRDKISASQIGKEVSEETRNKLSIARKTEDIEIICPTCDVTFTRKKYEINTTGGNYCSRKCMVESDEWRRKISDSKRGKHDTEETRKKKSESHMGDKNINYGKPVSDESRRKMSESKKQLVGELSPRWGTTHSSETRNKISCSLSGEKNPNWKNGSSSEPYCWKFNGKMKERVREFFGRVCQLCGKHETENKLKLSVHHVYAEKKACCEGDICNLKEMDELRKLFPKEIARFGEPEFSDDELIRIRMMIPLCKSCHSKTQVKSKYEYYRQFFDNLIMTKYGGKCYYTEEEYKEILNSRKNNNTQEQTCQT